jgi:hypothetical protein
VGRYTVPCYFVPRCIRVPKSSGSEGASSVCALVLSSSEEAPSPRVGQGRPSPRALSASRREVGGLRESRRGDEWHAVGCRVPDMEKSGLDEWNDRTMRRRRRYRPPAQGGVAGRGIALLVYRRGRCLPRIDSSASKRGHLPVLMFVIPSPAARRGKSIRKLKDHMRLVLGTLSSPEGNVPRVLGLAIPLCYPMGYPRFPLYEALNTHKCRV